MLTWCIFLLKAVFSQIAHRKPGPGNIIPAYECWGGVLVGYLVSGETMKLPCTVGLNWDSQSAFVLGPPNSSIRPRCQHLTPFLDSVFSSWGSHHFYRVWKQIQHQACVLGVAWGGAGQPWILIGPPKSQPNYPKAWLAICPVRGGS